MWKILDNHYKYNFCNLDWWLYGCLLAWNRLSVNEPKLYYNSFGFGLYYLNPAVSSITLGSLPVARRPPEPPLSPSITPLLKYKNPDKD